jgi:hypothetical protein
MKPEEFPSRRAGQVVRSPTGYWAFVPGALPPRIDDSLSLIRDRSKVDFRTAQKAIHDLEQVGILREITGQRRSRVWVAPEIMEVLTGRRPLEVA